MTTVREADCRVAQRFWRILGEVIPEWSAVIAGEAKAVGSYEHSTYMRTASSFRRLGSAGHQLLARSA